MGNKVLFLCTGNYYRSRFAEVLFNRKAEVDGLNWHAFSRGFRANNSRNVGPISNHALLGLSNRGIELAKPVRYPIQVTITDFNKANRVIALKYLEHRPYMERDYPLLMDAIDYWEIDDLDYESPDSALLKLETKVIELIDTL